MKRLLNKAIALALMAATWVGCVQEDYYLNTGQESESDIQISLNLNIPDPMQVTTRSGVTEAIENITVLCFDKNGGAIQVKNPEASLTKTGAETGTLTVKIPNATRVMHVFANQENVPFEKGETENELLVNLEATSDKMVYWGRMEVPSNLTSSSDIKKWWTNAEERSITLLRNMAKVEVVNKKEDKFTLLGYTVVNTNAVGMAVPYYAEKNVYPYTTTFNEEAWIKTDYIHVDENVGLVSGTGETMQTSGPIYVYETSKSTPASIIIKGYNNDDPDQTPKYWRVAFAGEDGEQINIRRNHLYTVSIEGHVLFGDETFEAAVANSSTANSAWLGIAPEVTAIKNNKFSLTVENTSYVFANGEKENLTFNFFIEQLGSEAFKESELSVAWEKNQEVSTANDVSYTLTKATDANVHTAAVTVPLKKFTDLEEQLVNHEGTIVIKYGKKLQRKVKVIIIPQQTFNIVSYNEVTSCEDGEGEEAGALVYTVSVDKDDYEKDDYTNDGAPIDKLKFILPINFPEELLPLNVLVSTTDFNVVNSPLIFKGAGGYGDEAIGPGYKYVYPVSEVGTECEIQLRYINNLLADKVTLTLEAENFNPVKLIIKYTLNDNTAE